MEKTTNTYFEDIGRRKTAVARVRLYPGKTSNTINDQTPKDYFKMDKLVDDAYAPFKTVDFKDKVGISVHVKGGGINAQSEAIRHGISRVLVKINPEFKSQLKTACFLTRDSRMVERKKPGLKKARRAPQWQKR